MQHIRDAALDALEFAEDASRSDLQDNRMLRYALARCLEIIGEAAGQITAETQAAAPAVPWDQIVGMRHRLAHAYYAINLDYLWDTVEVDLQPLLEEVERLLALPDQEDQT